MTPKQGKQGQNTSTVISTPARLKRSRTAREREEDRWAARSGPVTVTKLEDSSNLGEEAERESEPA